MAKCKINKCIYQKFYQSEIVGTGADRRDVRTKIVKFQTLCPFYDSHFTSEQPDGGNMDAVVAVRK